MSQKPLSNKAKEIVKLCETSIDDPIAQLRDKLGSIQRILKHPRSLGIVGLDLEESIRFSKYEEDDPDFVLRGKLHIIKQIL
jgi:hypothetical protein